MEPRQLSMWESITSIMNSMATSAVTASDAMGTVAKAAGRGATVLDLYAQAGEVLAEANLELVNMSTMGKTQMKRREIEERFPEVDWTKTLIK